MRHNDLLEQIGRELFGEAWRAPLARELDVSERSLRGWTALEDPIPDGVWRDLALKLEARRDKAGYWLGEVKITLGQVEVFAFEYWDGARGEMVKSRGKSTRARIERIGGSVVLGTSEWVMADEVDGDGRLRFHIEPSPTRDGFQVAVMPMRSGRPE